MMPPFMIISKTKTKIVCSTTEDEVIGIVKRCKHKTSTDSNDLRMSVIKQVIQPITLPLTSIFYMSFQTGVFPSSMKLAKIIPDLKVVQKQNLIITHQYLYYPNFLKYLKNCITKG